MKIKIQNLQGKKMKEQCFYQSVQFVIVKNQILSSN